MRIPDDEDEVITIEPSQDTDALWDEFSVSLSSRQREILDLRRQGLSIAEIADALGIRPLTVKKQMSLAYERIRQALRRREA